MSREVRRVLRIRGRVQGVGFRYFTQRAARRFALRGWVRNEADGSVACDVTGDVEAVERFLAEVRKGPGFARVDDVEVVDAVPEAAVEGFSIR